jgi:hypothetical protein
MSVHYTSTAARYTLLCGDFERGICLNTPYRVATYLSEKTTMASSTEPKRRPMAELSPEERMQRRYPQPVRVGDLIGLPVLDDDDRTIGRIRLVARTPQGKIQLVVPYGGFLGWGNRPVIVPIEVVAIAGRQVAALDMPRAEFDSAPVWDAAKGTPLAPDDSIRIALYKR